MLNKHECCKNCYFSWFVYRELYLNIRLLKTTDKNVLLDIRIYMNEAYTLASNFFHTNIQVYTKSMCVSSNYWDLKKTIGKEITSSYSFLNISSQSTHTFFFGVYFYSCVWLELLSIMSLCSCIYLKVHLYL